MLNYLLWDKENLQKQSATDKIEQDWLRGQNRTLQTTVDEQEAAINQLTNENKARRRGLPTWNVSSINQIASGKRN
jgi:thymidylate synthase